MLRPLRLVLAVAAVGALAPLAHAQIRLIAITGDLHSSEFHFEYGPDDETLYEINITNAAETRLFQVSRIPDTNTIGYNPNNGLLYHLSGSESYRNDPNGEGMVRWGFNDNQYMETVNLQTGVMTGVFNSNGPPATDAAPVFGLPAPRPDWVLPAERRTADQTDPSFRQKGEHEYGSARELAWSQTEGLWYLSSGDGLFKLTPEGDSTFVGAPALEAGDMKALEFVDIGGQPKLLMGSKETGVLYELDPTTGLEIGTPVQVVDTTSNPYNRILALATHPETNVLYGLVQPYNGAETARELVTIDPTTGATTLIGVLDAPAVPDPENPGEFIQPGFASMAFVGFSTGNPSDVDDDGDVDGNDFLLIQRGIGGAFDAADIAAWRTNFGQMGGIAAIPEPTALGLACVALAATMSAHRRKSI